MRKSYLFLVLFMSVARLYGQQWGVEGQNLHLAVPDGRVNKVWNGVDMIQGFSGKDVIIGVTDWGFDYTHPVFYDTSVAEYRILRAWDQYRNSGPAPQGFNYGTELVGKDVLLAAQCDTSNVYQYGYHGTHVASIAAGAGGKTAYRGVAYDANLLFVSIAISEQAVEDAFLWMYKVAQEEQKRLVVNMSWGLYYMGNMDGTGKMANLIDSLSNLGVVFVTSAGNNGDVNFHLGHTFSSDTLKSRIEFTNLNNEWGQSISMTNSANTPFSFAVQVVEGISPIELSPYYHTNNGNCYIDTFLVIPHSDTLTDTLFYNVSIEQRNQYNNRPQARLRVKKPPTTFWKIGLFVTAQEGDFHAWNVAELENEVGNWGGGFSTGNMAGWVAGDKNCGIGTPANFPATISVAAHTSVYKLGATTQGGYICSFSSRGFTIDNRLKPEISAPGYDVAAAVSSFNNQLSPSSYLTTVEHNGRNYPFSKLSGTSMASPFVAGVAALMLQANPYLSTKQVKDILMETAYSDRFVERDGEIRFGRGKVDAHQAVMKALETAGISNFEIAECRIALFPNPVSDMLYLSIQSNKDNSVEMELYDLSGRKLKQQTFECGVNTMNVSHLAAGYYLLKFSDGKRSWTKKFIKK
ncbi:MAG: S8 family peptidase [Bacteroidales bacterium]|jgi:subtilisin family serine protease|nr:S8 family peptidase [Bacteroidales bacterium]